MQDVVILGAGGLAREVADIITACGTRYRLLGFIDDDPAKHGLHLNGFPVLGDFRWFDTVDAGAVKAVAGVGSPAVRRKLVQKAQARDVSFVSLVHPAVVMSEFVNLGEGVVITAGCILTNRITLGDHTFINLNCTIGHDAVLDAFCNLNPGVHISGSVHLEPGCDVGTGAAIIQGINVGHWSILGAGAVVTRDLPPNVTAVGVPAKVIKTREEGWYEQ